MKLCCIFYGHCNLISKWADNLSCQNPIENLYLFPFLYIFFYIRITHTPIPLPKLHLILSHLPLHPLHPSPHIPSSASPPDPPVTLFLPLLPSPPYPPSLAPLLPLSINTLHHPHSSPHLPSARRPSRHDPGVGLPQGPIAVQGQSRSVRGRFGAVNWWFKGQVCSHVP